MLTEQLRDVVIENLSELQLAVYAVRPYFKVKRNLLQRQLKLGDQLGRVNRLDDSVTQRLHLGRDSLKVDDLRQADAKLVKRFYLELPDDDLQFSEVTYGKAKPLLIERVPDEAQEVQDRVCLGEVSCLVLL